MPDPIDPTDLEGQDLAEVFDEENITPDGRDIATSDLQRDVYDVTSADGDATDALADDDDFDPDAADEAELEEIVMAEEDLDEPRSFAGDGAERIAGDDLQPADFEASDPDAEIEALSDDPEEAAAEKADLERRLDEALGETFPASDPVSVSRGAG
jgi:hypothetical protein